MLGGPRKEAAVNGRQSSRPYMVRAGSSARRDWAVSSPRSRARRVTMATQVM